MILTTDVILKSRFASLLFANILSCFAKVLIHFPNFYHLINGLTKRYTNLDFFCPGCNNEVYTRGFH